MLGNLEQQRLNNIVIGSRDGKAVYLRDVATVNDTLQSRIQENYTNGRRSASIIVQKQSGANTVAIADAVRAELVELQKNLPPDIKIETVMDTSDHIKVSINSLLETIFLALIIVGVVVLLFLGRWRATIYSDFTYWFVHLSLSNREHHQYYFALGTLNNHRYGGG